MNFSDGVRRKPTRTLLDAATHLEGHVQGHVWSVEPGGSVAVRWQGAARPEIIVWCGGEETPCPVRQEGPQDWVAEVTLPADSLYTTYSVLDGGAEVSAGVLLRAWNG